MMDYGYAGWTRDENFLKVRMNLKKVFCCWFLLSNGRMSGIFVLFLAWRHLLIERLGALTLIIKIKIKMTPMAIDGKGVIRFQ